MRQIFLDTFFDDVRQDAISLNIISLLSKKNHEYSDKSISSIYSFLESLSNGKENFFCNHYIPYDEPQLKSTKFFLERLCDKGLIKGEEFKEERSGYQRYELTELGELFAKELSFLPSERNSTGHKIFYKNFSALNRDHRGNVYCASSFSLETFSS